MDLTCWVEGSSLWGWRCWLPLLVLLELEIVLSPILWGVTLSALMGLDLLRSSPLVGDPPTAGPRPLACLSWALIRSFCLVSWVISASIAFGESCEWRCSEVSDSDELEGSLLSGKLFRLEAELTSRDGNISTGGSWCCRSRGWVTVEETEPQI